MRRTVIASIVLPAALTAALPASAPARARGFSLGVAAAEVTDSSALLWARADRGGRYAVQVARDRRFLRVVARGGVSARRADDGTIRVTTTRLRANTRFYYRFLGGGGRHSDTGTFRTAPRPDQNATIRFAWSGDEDGQRQPGSSRPYFNRLEVMRAMARENDNFDINFGDTMYSDTEVPASGSGIVTGEGVKAAAPSALTVAAKWAKYRQNLALPNYRLLRASGGVYNHWDDHEFINDYSRSETLPAQDAAGRTISVRGGPLYAPSVKAFRDYMPVSFSSRNGIYRSFRWGRNLELFFLDERSFRSAKASANGTCDNPQTGQPDLAPTGPPTVRAAFAVVAPSLAAPVSPACLRTINDPNRTMLGGRQLSRFERAIRRSKATFKVIMNEVPIQQFYAQPYDRWEGYAAERTKLLRYLKAHVRNAIFLTTDVHANLVNDARFATFPSEGGPRNSGILDVTTGPVAIGTYGREIDATTGKPGNGRLVDSIFFTNQPTASGIPGVGMRCSVIDTFSYGQVTVTSRRLTVQLKDAARRPLREEEAGARCPAVVLDKK